jgi:hypothetical protein
VQIGKFSLFRTLFIADFKILLAEIQILLANFLKNIAGLKPLIANLIFRQFSYSGNDGLFAKTPMYQPKSLFICKVDLL